MVCFYYIFRSKKSIHSRVGLINGTKFSDGNDENIYLQFSNFESIVVDVFPQVQYSK